MLRIYKQDKNILYLINKCKYFLETGDTIITGWYHEDNDELMLVHDKLKHVIIFQKDENVLVTQNGEVFMLIDPDEFPYDEQPDEGIDPDFDYDEPS